MKSHQKEKEERHVHERRHSVTRIMRHDGKHCWFTVHPDPSSPNKEEELFCEWLDANRNECMAFSDTLISDPTDRGNPLRCEACITQVKSG